MSLDIPVRSDAPWFRWLTSLPPGRPTAGEGRGLRFRQGDDHAVELLGEAETCLADLPRLDRILLELGRFYNPVANEPIVDLATRRRIVARPGSPRGLNVAGHER